MIAPPDDILERIAAALERIAAALESGATGSRLAVANPREAAVAEVRRVMRAGELAHAAVLLGDLRVDFPDAAEGPALAEELANLSLAAVDDRRARLDAARRASDPDACITLRDELSPLLDPSARETLDADLLKWLMALLMKRLRAGTVGPDVAALATRLAGSFSHRPEGASLRASLPTLRRSAGLCPRCAQPYIGVEDACPDCLVATPRIADLPETPIPPT